MRKLPTLIVAATTMLVVGLIPGTDTARSAGHDAYGAGMPHSPAAAPDFTLQDLRGKARSLKDFRGKVVLLYFTTTWCPYCKKEIPSLKKLHASLKGRDFALVSIYVNESPKRVAQFVEKYSIPYTVLVDSDMAVARNYGVRGVPMKVVVDKKGMIGCYQCTSAEEKVDELLKRY